MKPIIKISMLVIIIAGLILACGRLDIGIEPTPTQPSAPINTPTKASGSNQLQNTQTSTPVTELNDQTSAEDSLYLDCTEFGVDPLITTACNIRASFISRNTQPLLSYMPPEFALGYWQSEWTTVTPQYAIDFYHQSLSPPDPGQMTFTIDRSQFPPLFGIPIDGMLGPDAEIALIIYSEGWGKDGKGAVLLFITGNEASGYRFPAMLVSGEHFDK